MNAMTPTAQLRIPRPNGLTLALRKVALLPPKQEKKAIKEIYVTIIRNYVQAGLVINGQVLSIQELGNYLNLTHKQVTLYLGRVTKSMAGLLQPKQLTDTYRALMYQAQINSLADRGRAEAQLDVFNRAQLNDMGVMVYRPFISGQALQALDVVMKANSGMMAAAKALVPNPSLAIQNNHYHGQDGEANKYIGTEEAMKMISTGKKDGTVPQLSQAEIYEINGIGDMPEVKATIGNDPGASKLQLATQATKHEERRLATEGLTDTEEMG